MSNTRTGRGFSSRSGRGFSSGSGRGFPPRSGRGTSHFRASLRSGGTWTTPLTSVMYDSTRPPINLKNGTTQQHSVIQSNSGVVRYSICIEN
jgi:hypothetical protein